MPLRPIADLPNVGSFLLFLANAFGGDVVSDGAAAVCSLLRCRGGRDDSPDVGRNRGVRVG